MSYKKINLLDKYSLFIFKFKITTKLRQTLYNYKVCCRNILS